MSYTNIITWAKINKIRLWEPLETQTIQPKKYMKYAKEFGYDGQMLPIINYMIIHHTLTYWGIILSMINPFIAIDNGSDNTVGGSYYSAHQAVGKLFCHIDMASCVHRKCQTRAGVSGDVNKMLECVTITESKFSNRVLE